MLKGKVLAKWQTELFYTPFYNIMVLFEDDSIETKGISYQTYTKVNVGDICVFQETCIKGE